MNFSKKIKICIYKRSFNIPKYHLLPKIISVHRGLFNVVYRNKIYNRHYKYGMFALTRKPFAKPLKKTKKKR